MRIFQFDGTLMFSVDMGKASPKFEDLPVHNAPK